MGDFLLKYNKKEICYILTVHLKIEVNEDELSNVKLIFIKYYSRDIINKIQFLIKNKLTFLIRFFSSDGVKYFDEEENVRLLVDTMSLYSFEKNDKKYYLCFSKLNDPKMLGITNEKVELFKKK